MRKPEPMYLSDEELAELIRLSDRHDIIEEKLRYSYHNSPYVPFYSLYLSIQLAPVAMQMIKLIQPKYCETQQDCASMSSKHKFTTEHFNMSLHANNSVLTMCKRLDCGIFPHFKLRYHELCLERQLKKLLPIKQYKEGISLW